MKILQRIARILSISPYEAANYSSRRSRVPGAAPTDAKKELTPHARRELVRKSRYLNKNSGFAREVVGDMAIYSTGDGILPQTCLIHLSKPNHLPLLTSGYSSFPRHWPQEASKLAFLRSGPMIWSPV